MLSLFESGSSNGVAIATVANESNRENEGELRKISAKNFPLKKRVFCWMRENPVDVLETKEKLASNDEKGNAEKSKDENRESVQHDYLDYSDERPPAGYDNIPRADRDVTFCTKLLFLLDSVEEDGYGHVISWQPHGRCFLVRDPDQIMSILSMYLEITKWTSFQRQIYIYGFKRITRAGPDRGGYYHPKFLRGRTFLATQINRVTIKGTRVRQKTNPEEEPNFWDLPFVQPLPEDAALAAAASQQSSLLNMKRRILFQKKAQKRVKEQEEKEQEETDDESAQEEHEEKLTGEQMAAPNTSKRGSPMQTQQVLQESRQPLEEQTMSIRTSGPSHFSRTMQDSVQPKPLQAYSGMHQQQVPRYQDQHSGLGHMSRSHLEAANRDEYEALLRASLSFTTKPPIDAALMQGPSRAAQETSPLFIEAPRLQGPQSPETITPAASSLSIERPPEYCSTFEQDRTSGMIVVDMSRSADSRVVGFSTHLVPVGTPVLLVPPDHPVCACLADNRSPCLVEVPTTTTESGGTAYVFEVPPQPTAGSAISFMGCFSQATSHGVKFQVPPDQQRQHFVASRAMVHKTDIPQVNRGNFLVVQEQPQHIANVHLANRSSYLAQEQARQAVAKRAFALAQEHNLPQRFDERASVVTSMGPQVRFTGSTPSSIDDLLKSISNLHEVEKKRSYEEMQQVQEAGRPAQRASFDTSAVSSPDLARGESQQNFARRQPTTVLQPQHLQSVLPKRQAEPSAEHIRSSPVESLSSSERTAPVANRSPERLSPASAGPVAANSSSFRDPDQIATKQQVVGALEGLMMLGSK